MGPGRPRSIQVDEGIFTAALAIVGEQGYGRLTVEGVAARSGVSKASIYRRFSSRSELAAEALLARYPIGPDPVEPGEGAVRRHLTRIFEAINASAAPVLRGLMGDAQLDPAFGERFRTRFIMSRRLALAEAIRLEYGRVASEELLLDVVLGATWYRLLAGHARLDAVLAVELSELVARTITAEP
jgi:AcrR family transcriptional regulator